MAQLHKVFRVLTDKDWAPFHALCADRRMTIDQANAWLTGRGYTVGRSSVGRYMRRVREMAAMPAQLALRCRSERSLRRKIAAWVEALSGHDLMIVGMVAACCAAAVIESREPSRTHRLKRARKPG